MRVKAPTRMETTGRDQAACAGFERADVTAVSPVLAIEPERGTNRCLYRIAGIAGDGAFLHYVRIFVERSSGACEFSYCKGRAVGDLCHKRRKPWVRYGDRNAERQSPVRCRDGAVIAGASARCG